MSDLKGSAITFALVGIVHVAGLVIGGYTVGKHYRAQIAETEAKAAERIAKQEQESYEIYAKQQDALMDALAQRDKALASVRTLRADAGRLRDKLNERAEADKAIGAGDGGGERLARCERLLAEGVGLAGEGAELSRRIAVDKDALAAAIK